MIEDRELEMFYKSSFDKLFSDKNFREMIISHSKDVPLTFSGDNEKEIFMKMFKFFIEESQHTLSLLKRIKFTKKTKILEIGGAGGFLYAYMKERGFDIHSIEPSEAGFSEYYKTAIQLFRIIGTNTSGWYPYRADQLKKIKMKFDIIVSNNVLEHIQDTEGTLIHLKNAMNDDGIMIHNTNNYNLPYDPHFKTFLVPLLPRLTEFFRPNLKKSELWKGLNFVTVGRLKSACKSSELIISFERGTILKTFERLKNDKEFAKRQGHFMFIYKFLKKNNLIGLLNKIPVTLTTPIVFTIRKKKTG